MARGDTKKAVETVLRNAAIEKRPNPNGGPPGSMQPAEIIVECERLNGVRPKPAAVHQALTRGKSGSTRSNQIYEKVDQDGKPIDGGQHGFWLHRNP